MTRNLTYMYCIFKYVRMCEQSHACVNAITCLSAKTNQGCKHAYKHESAASVYYHKYSHTQTCAQTVRNKILKICAYKYMSICVATATPCDRKIAK